VLGKHHGIEPNVHIHIVKQIPVGGGMAGGSADAATALVACDALWNLRMGRDDLISLAAEPGSTDEIPSSAPSSTEPSRLTPEPAAILIIIVATGALCRMYPQCLRCRVAQVYAHGGGRLELPADVPFVR
jgi:hypothetical protein